jgi:hypothetical protein
MPPMRFAVSESAAHAEAGKPRPVKPPVHHGVVSRLQTPAQIAAARNPAIGGSQTEDAGLTTVLQFFMKILSAQLAKSNSPLVKLMDQLIAQKFPRGFQVGPDYSQSTRQPDTSLSARRGSILLSLASTRSCDWPEPHSPD